MRAPPESFSPMIGAPTRMAMSMILTILAALVSESEPPKTVKSCAKTKTVRPVDGAVAGDEAVARNALLVHAEVGGAVGDELVGLLEGAVVEQQLDTLARRELACLVLALAAFRAPGFFGQGVAAFQFSNRGGVGMAGMGLVHARANYRDLPSTRKCLRREPL